MAPGAPKCPASTSNPKMHGTRSPHMPSTSNPKMHGTRNPNMSDTCNLNMHGTRSPKMPSDSNPKRHGNRTPQMPSTSNPTPRYLAPGAHRCPHWETINWDPGKDKCSSLQRNQQIHKDLCKLKNVTIFRYLPVSSEPDTENDDAKNNQKEQHAHYYYQHWKNRKQNKYVSLENSI